MSHLRYLVEVDLYMLDINVLFAVCGLKIHLFRFS